MSATDAATFWNGVYAAPSAATDPQPNALLTDTRCARAGDCWSSTTARPRHGRGIRTPTSAIRARGKSRRASLWIR
jgi:hypothetical protein